MMGILKNKKEKEMKEQKAKNTIVEVIKWVGPVLLAVLLFVVIRFGIMNRDYTLESINADKYISLVNSNKDVLVYFTTDECEMCDEAETLFKRVLKGSNIKIYQVEINKLSDEDIAKIMEVLDITKEGIEAPLLILVNNKELISNFRVPVDEDLFIEYLQKNNLVK